MKNGLQFENDKLIYYQDGVPYHGGIIKVDDAIYYIDSTGCAVKGRYVVRTAMANGLLKHGIYTFGDDFKLVQNSYVPLKKIRRRRRSRKQTLLSILLLVISVLVLACLIFANASIGTFISPFWDFW